MTGGRIVVGIDGSPASRAALRWAMSEARLRDASVEVVHAWDFPSIALRPYGSTALPVIVPEDLDRAAHERLQYMLADLPESEKAAVAWTTTVTRGHPADALLRAAKEADLLVVGSRGHGGFTGMLLGSVSNHVAQHATCPVVIVRNGPDKR